MPRPLTDEERNTFKFIHDRDSNTGLIQVVFDGEDVAVIAAFDEAENDEIIVTPLAVLVTPAMFAKMTDPTTD